MEKSQDKEKNYIFLTSINYSSDPDDFIVELFCPDDEEEDAEPKKVIRNFDELISFFENLDEDKNTKKNRAENDS
nr:hypothetical protein [uncultured Bacillus sp.]